MLMKTKKTIMVNRYLNKFVCLSAFLFLGFTILALNTDAQKTQKTPTVQPKPAKKGAVKPEKTKLTDNKNNTKPNNGIGQRQKPTVSQNPIVKDSIQIGSGENAIKIPTEPIVDNLPKGKVDWTNQFIEAKGQSVIDNERFKNVAQAKLMAKRGAIVDAQRNLLEITKGVQVTSETKVQDMITTSDYIYSRVDGVIKNAIQVGEAVEKEGFIEVTMRISIYDQKGLAPVLYDQVAKKMNTMNSNVVAINPVDQSTETSATTEASATTEITDMSNLVLNFNGKKYDASMFPVVLDENNNLLLDYSKIYDPKKGVFPKIVSAGKSILEIFGVKKGVEVLNVIESSDGKIKIDTSTVKNKINWSKIGKIASTIGKFAMALVL